MIAVIGYLLDAIPKRGGLEVVLDGNRRSFVRTTFPIYIITDEPEKVMQYPSVLSYEREEWFAPPDYKRKITLFRYELDSVNAFYYLVKKCNVVNTFPSVVTQTLLRLGVLPTHLIEVGNKVRLMEPEDSLVEPKLTIVTVERYDWYGITPKGRYYRVYRNYELIEEGKGVMPRFTADIAECIGNCNVESPIVINRTRSFLKARQLIEWSRVGRVLLREVMYSTIGKVLTTNEAVHALRRKYIVPRIKTNVEKLKTLDELSYMDKGGLILIPRPGCYNNVKQIDFSSMYPTIISRFNISPETVDECDDVDAGVHKICTKRRGLVAEAIEWLIDRKEKLKSIDEERAEAVKWILVASFGYLGYRHSRFGRIEAYESVTYIARKTLRKALQVLGDRAIHGIVDSVAYQGDKSLAEKVREVTGMKLKVESYDWFVISESGGDGVPTRYFARGNGMKVRGVIRRNMPNLVKDFLANALKVMQKADSCEELLYVIPDIYTLYREYKRRNFEPRDYVIEVNGNYLIRGNSGFYNAELGFHGGDREYYLNYLNRALSTLLKPIVGVPGNRPSLASHE
ncbi:DNA polymerase II [Sulfolobales archaeon HS-7]|nr:DNA polymerase II [Sulfolobales archaeon HS-7]